MADSEKSINLKTCDDPFLFTQNGFLQHTTRAINSGIIIVMLSGIFIDVIPVFLNFLVNTKVIEECKKSARLFQFSNIFSKILPQFFEYATSLLFKLIF